MGGNIGLDLLSQISQRYARIMGGIGRGASFPKSTWPGAGLGKAGLHPDETGLGLAWPASARPGAGLGEAGRHPDETGLENRPRPGLAGLEKQQNHPTRKRTYLDHPDFVFDVLGLVGIATKSFTRSCGETS